MLAQKRKKLRFTYLAPSMHAAEGGFLPRLQRKAVDSHSMLI